jgi:7-cyano-7-deazaguanine synthase
MRDRSEILDTVTDSVAIVSGGMDSITMLYDMITNGLTPRVLSFNYGQRHKKELDYARIHADRMGLPHNIVDLSSITHLISNSALTSPYDIMEGRAIDVPEGHYAADNMALTVVPNRNMIMAAIAAGVAVNDKACTIGIGIHAGDHYQYPDCRPEFIKALEHCILVATNGFNNFKAGYSTSKSLASDPIKYQQAELDIFGGVEGQFGMAEVGTIYAPFLMKTKADIAFMALEMQIPLDLTWSCYKGGDVHCGRCGTCVERLEAIAEAGAKMNESMMTWEDNTIYADTEFWKATVKPATPEDV